MHNVTTAQERKSLQFVLHVLELWIFRFNAPPSVYIATTISSP